MRQEVAARPPASSVSAGANKKLMPDCHRRLFLPRLPHFFFLFSGQGIYSPSSLCLAFLQTLHSTKQRDARRSFVSRKPQYKIPPSPFVYMYFRSHVYHILFSWWQFPRVLKNPMWSCKMVTWDRLRKGLLSLTSHLTLFHLFSPWLVLRIEYFPTTSTSKEWPAFFCKIV